MCDVRLGILSGFQGEAVGQTLDSLEQAQNLDKMISLMRIEAGVCDLCRTSRAHRESDQGAAPSLYLVFPRGNLTVCAGSSGHRILRLSPCIISQAPSVINQPSVKQRDPDGRGPLPTFCLLPRSSTDRSHLFCGCVFRKLPWRSVPWHAHLYYVARLLIQDGQDWRGKGRASR